jgi:hypothetical protein
MKSVLFLLFCILSTRVFAQEKTVSGIIFDIDSKDRIAKINVINLSTKASVYNNLSGEFKINAVPGDKLVFARTEYHSDTIVVKNQTPLAIYMKRLAIQLKEVTILDSLLDPKKRLASARSEYAKAYGSLASDDYLTVGPSGAGLGIDALYNLFSRSGRNARHLRETIQKDYAQNVIDYRFNKALVTRITGLKGLQLDDFMLKYRPGYFFATYSNDYEFISSIKTNLKRYQHNPRAHALAPLQP